MSSHYAYGRRKELQVAEFLKRRGFACGRAQGSRGAVDLVAKKNTLRLVIQVKATRNDFTSYTRLRPGDQTRLLRSAAPQKARPVLALVARNYVWLVSVPDQDLMAEGELKPLRYEYPGHS